LICAIHGGTIATASEQFRADIGSQSRIVSIANRIASQEIDATGLAAVARIDSHVQISPRSGPEPSMPNRHAGQSRDFCAYIARLTFALPERPL
jgi:hypothetical protein